uniref:CUE domain-containing protein n=1 Tax=Rhodosorus marinus TaxID=101924 RepID=A0A7S2ZU04_9RHOD|mmetsp:Transcript_32556/g.127702  ORF Transcript_32556/g.127702 Transcript_32556/m.127702 type:complete len:220 (+) Transcript_32556:127-786(+)
MNAELEQKVSAMVAIFPAMSRDRLRSALDSQGGNVDSAINMLLADTREPEPSEQSVNTSIVYDSGNPALDAARTLQLAEDERLAQMLQREEISNANGAGTGLGDMNIGVWSLPSATDVRSGMHVMYDNIKYYSDAAYRRMVDLYEQYVEGGEGSARGERIPHESVEDEVRVVRSGMADETQASQRTVHTAGYSVPSSRANDVVPRRRPTATVAESSKDK